MPFGEYDIYNCKHLFEALTRLIIEYPNIQRWIFKIDDDFDGFGIAYCDIAIHLPSYAQLFKSREKDDVQSVQVEEPPTNTPIPFSISFFRKNSMRKFYWNYRLF